MFTSINTLLKSTDGWSGILRWLMVLRCYLLVVWFHCFIANQGSEPKKKSSGPWITENKAFLKSMLVDKDFLAWLLIGWWLGASPNFVPKCLIKSKSALDQVMAWQRAGDKPLPAAWLPKLYVNTRPQWVIIANRIIPHIYPILSLSLPAIGSKANWCSARPPLRAPVSPPSYWSFEVSLLFIRL